MARPHGLVQDRLTNYTIVVIAKKFHSWLGNIYMILYEIYVWAQPTGISAGSCLADNVMQYGSEVADCFVCH